MENASKIMYKIANVFNWIELVLGAILAIVAILMGANVIKPDASSDPNGWIALLIVAIWFVAIALILILLTRRAYKAGTSKAWDICFLILGVISGDIFYFLGGLFGIIGSNQ
jgi:uncharacterized membrane protein YhaH (DUF805 family)